MLNLHREFGTIGELTPMLSAMGAFFSHSIQTPKVPKMKPVIAESRTFVARTFFGAQDWYACTHLLTQIPQWSLSILPKKYWADLLKRPGSLF